MKEKKRISTFTRIIFILCAIVGIELILILMNVFNIKNENGRLNYEIYKAREENRKLKQENKNLEEIIKNFQEPKIATPDLPEGWRLYRHLAFGFEIGFPKDWKVTEATGIKEKTSLCINSDNNKIKLVVNAANIKDYWNIENYISKKYKYSIYVKDGLLIGSEKYYIYKQQGDEKYYIFILGKNYIFDICSNSEEYLIKVVATLKFI